MPGLNIFVMAWTTPCENFMSKIRKIARGIGNKRLLQRGLADPQLLPNIFAPGVNCIFLFASPFGCVLALA